MTDSCKDCKYWGPRCGLLDSLVWASCAQKVSNSSHKNSLENGLQIGGYYTPQNGLCEYFGQRPGEPLGTGLSRFWWHPTLFLPASIIHDLRYDQLKPGESTAAIDKEWHRNALQLSDSWAMRRLADVGYVLIRAYGRFLR